MTETLEKKINRFIEFNKAMITAAVSTNNLENQGVHAKILLCSIIDSLAKSRFPDKKTNGTRFQQTVKTSANWLDCDRISLLHLKRAIEIEQQNDVQFADLNTWAEDVISRNFATSESDLSARIDIAKDPMPEDVLALWPHDEMNQPIKLGGSSWDKLTHKNLLWQYRNSLMHEYRIPGRALEYNVKTSIPFYQQISQIDEGCLSTGLIFTNSWELLYPTGFFQIVAENTLEGVAAYHKSAQTCPFAAYSDGSFWIPKFNDKYE
ncbi:hypothetical protein Q3O60_05300 [Alkalimonas collagenimarina]|uniref:RiboL-PSP-HEPN domain-containing protein n=1 Tax=Alkalimonas collagenimarina TaxID=400390 RepID=A0ABT9GX04_9GAMM|nr:hypothetical protein [Alkalimonas collagenimarina]MDP4535594.1 hypothetical protein [Alkalimonas collagenimarina]